MDNISPYKESTIKRLFTLSRNKCAFPNCDKQILERSTDTIIGEICHIRGRKEKSPRFDKDQTDFERNDFENLILMCSVHHKIIDDEKNLNEFTVEKLIEIKKKHETTPLLNSTWLDNEMFAKIVKWLTNENVIDFEDIGSKYLDYLIKTNEYIDPRGIVQTRRAIVLKLDEVYVSLRAKQECSTIDRDLFTNSSQERGHQSLYHDVTELAEIVRKNAHFIILGNPGAGKTTILRFLTHLYANTLLKDKHSQNVTDKDGNDYGRPLIPIFLRIASYAIAYKNDKNRSLRDFLLHNCEECNMDPNLFSIYLNKILEDGHGLVLLDGLDEVIEIGNRLEISRRIEKFVSSYSKNHFIITSRIAGYRSISFAGEFSKNTYILQDLSRDDVKRFLFRWCTAVEYTLKPDGASADIDSKVEEDVDNIIEAITSNPGVERLAVNPLLLTILALIHRGGARLPSRRVDLYELSIKTLLEDWELARGISEEVIVRESEALNILGPLAYWMHEEKNNGIALEGEVKEKLMQILKMWRGEQVPDNEIEAIIDNFLNRVRQNTGVFVERSLKQYGFMHLTFEEYFAAREMIRRHSNEAKEVYKHRFDPRWKEVILLAFAFNSKNHPEDTMDLITSVILGQGEDQSYKVGNFDSVLHRGLLLAGEIIADCASELEFHKSGIIIHNLVELYLESVNKGIYHLEREISSILWRLNGTDLLNNEAKLMIKSLKEKNSKFQVEKIKFLGRFYHDSQELVGFFISLVNVTDPSIRGAIFRAYGEMGEYNEEMIDTLEVGLKDVNPILRLNALYAIGEIVKNPKESMVECIRSLIITDCDNEIRADAISICGSLKIVSRKDIFHLILKYFKDPDDCVRLEAVSSFAELLLDNHDLLDALDILIKISKDNAGLLEITERIEQEQEEITEIFLEMLTDENDDVREGIIYALLQVDFELDEIINFLTKESYNKKPEIRVKFINTLGKIEYTHRNITDRLNSALKDPDFSVRASAAFSLGNLEVTPGQVIDDLLNMLKDTNANVRVNSLFCISNIDHLPSGVIDDLLPMLKDKDAGVRANAVNALGNLDKIPNRVINEFMRMLKDEDVNVRANTAYVLRNLDELPGRVIDNLLNTLKDIDVSVRTNSACTLIDKGVELVAAIKIVKEILNESVDNFIINVDCLEYLKNIALYYIQNQNKNAILEIIDFLIALINKREHRTYYYLEIRIWTFLTNLVTSYEAFRVNKTV